MNFPRSDGPLVTVLLPTRGRPELLIQAVTSLHQRASRPDKIEWLFRVDTDDPNTQYACCKLIDQLPQATMVVEPRGTGYVNIHLWQSRLCQLARGDWIMLFNDDAIMTTPRWDDQIANLQVENFPHPDIASAYFVTKDRPGCNEFFMIRRKVWEVLGFLSLSTHVDNWLHRVLTQCNACGTMPHIVIDHSSNLMQDQTRRDSVSAYTCGNVPRSIIELESPVAQKGIADSAARLKEYIKNTPVG